MPDDTDCLRRQLAAAREVIEAARRLVNNAKYDVDPVDVYELREAIKRYTDTEDELTNGAKVAARRRYQNRALNTWGLDAYDRLDQ